MLSSSPSPTLYLWQRELRPVVLLLQSGTAIMQGTSWTELGRLQTALETAWPHCIGKVVVWNGLICSVACQDYCTKAIHGSHR